MTLQSSFRRCCAAMPAMGLATALAAQAATQPSWPAPKLWEETALAGWSVPLAGLGVPPTHLSAELYYRAPVDNLLTYPVYHPRHEPPGYRQRLMELGPQPLIQPDALRTEAEWVAAGQLVFEALDTPASRTADPEVLAHFLDADAVDRYRDDHHDVVDKDGILLEYRWVVTADRKLQISLSSCAGCHTRLMPDGSRLAGAPCNFDIGDSPAAAKMLQQLRPANHMAGEAFYLQHGVPWRADDEHRALRDMTAEKLHEFQSQETGAPPGTVFARFGGSPLFTTRMADLRGVRHRAFLDTTATHRNRGPADVARYGILVEYAEATEFGSHRLAPPQAPKVRPPDAAMYALAHYLYSLEPPPSPQPIDALALRGRQVFADEGCAKCHQGPQYDSPKLFAVEGADLRRDDQADDLPIAERRIDTDSGLALKTRKGTGMYRVPSLRGLWYRGLFGHSGDVASLEDWFDERRLRADYRPSGWRGPGVTQRAVPGHEFGLDLTAEDKRALLAFLRTL